MCSKGNDVAASAAELRISNDPLDTLNPRNISWYVFKNVLVLPEICIALLCIIGQLDLELLLEVKVVK